MNDFLHNLKPALAAATAKKMAPRFSSEFRASPWIISFFLAFHFFLVAGKFSLKLIALNCYLFCKTESSLCYWSCRYCRIPGEIKSSSRITLRWHWWSNEKFSNIFFPISTAAKGCGTIEMKGLSANRSECGIKCDTMKGNETQFVGSWSNQSDFVNLICRQMSERRTFMRVVLLNSVGKKLNWRRNEDNLVTNPICMASPTKLSTPASALVDKIFYWILSSAEEGASLNQKTTKT